MNLFFHQAALGDFVLTFPIIRCLCTKADRTVVISRQPLAQLAATEIVGVTPMDIERRDFTRLHAKDGHVDVGFDTRKLFEQATRIVSFVSNGMDAWACNVAALAPSAHTLFMDTQPPDDWIGHVSKWQQAQLQRQGLTLKSTMPSGYGSPEGPIVVHPGSGGQNKRWPVENFECLIDQLSKSNRSVQPVLGEVELAGWSPETTDRWCSEFDARVIQNVIALHELLLTAGAYIGNDAGPTHLAAQLGLPTFALFGPTDPMRWSPLGPQVKLVAPDRPLPMGWLSVDTVFTLVTSN